MTPQTHVLRLQITLALAKNHAAPTAQEDQSGTQLPGLQHPEERRWDPPYHPES